MSNQVQCPNCGGYKTTSETTPITQKVSLSSSQRKEQRKTGLTCLSLLVGFTFIISLLVGDWGIFTLIAAMVIVGVPIVLLIESFQRNPMTTKTVGYVYHSTCLICGFHWDWREGQEKPEVHVRPDLIARGEQRLREEAQQAEIANRVAQDILNRKP